MENSLLRMYLVNACTNNKQEKVHEFFEKLGNDLQHQLEWKDWFGILLTYYKFSTNIFLSKHNIIFIALPFIKNPEENPAYLVYFTRQWQDTMLISLHNLLAVSFQVLQLLIAIACINYRDHIFSSAYLNQSLLLTMKRLHALLVCKLRMIN